MHATTTLLSTRDQIVGCASVPKSRIHAVILRTTTTFTLLLTRLAKATFMPTTQAHAIMHLWNGSQQTSAAFKVRSNPKGESAIIGCAIPVGNHCGIGSGKESRNRPIVAGKLVNGDVMWRNDCPKPIQAFIWAA